MNNIPENENLNSEETSPAAAEEFSTVFSDPAAHSKSAQDVKRKKRLPIIIASILFVAVLAVGTVAVVKLIPEREDDETDYNSVEDITVLDGSSDDYKTVTVKNSSGSFKLYSVTETVEAEDDESSADESAESQETVTWYLDGYSKNKTDSSSIASVVSSAVSLTASREVTAKTEAECGLDKPVITVKAEPKEGDTFTLSFGCESPDKTGYYLKLSNKDSIYVVGSDVLEAFEFEALDFAETEAFPAFEVTDGMDAYTDDDGALTSFDSITVSGKSLEKDVVIEMNKDEALNAVAAYTVTSPTKRVADNVDGIFSIFKSGLSVTGAYSFDTSASSLAKVGLNSPDLTVTMRIGKKSMTYRFKLQDDGSYAAVCDGTDLIKRVDASSLEFASYTVNDFYSSWVALVSIDTLKGFTFEANGNTYDFGIKQNNTDDDEESEDDENEEDYTITYGGEQLVASDFQSFYQECISLSCTDFNTEKLSGTPEYSMVFKYSDGSKLNVDFTKASETRYQYSLNGTPYGKVNSSAMSKLLKSVEKLTAKQ